MKFDLLIFKNKNFLLYWISSWCTALGDAIFIITLTWMLTEETNSPTVVGTYLFILGCSKAIFILIGGIVVDRIDSRKLMITTYLVRSLLMIIFFCVNLEGIPSIWVFYAMASIFGVVDSISEPAVITWRTKILEKQYYTQSMSLLMLTGNISTVLGPMVATGIIYLSGSKVVLLVNATTYVVASLLFIMITPVKENNLHIAPPLNSLLNDFKVGLFYFLKTPIILTMAIFAFFTNAAIGVMQVSVPFLVKDYGYGIETFGLLNTAIAVGSVIGGIIFSLLVISNARPTMTIITCFFQGIILLLVGHVNHIWLMVSLFALIGLLETAVNVIAPSVNHTIIPPKIFGRVISILILVMSGSIPISQAIAGYLMKWIEPNTIFIYAGVLEISAAVMVFSLPFVRNYNVNQKNTTN